MKKSECTGFLVLAAAVLLFLPSFVSAAPTNMVVSPPPIPWFEFYQGQFDLKLTGDYAQIDGKGENSDVSIQGAGISLNTRYAFIDQFALDFMFNYLYANGVYGTYATEVDVHFLCWNPNFEIQPVNTDKFNLILLFGYMWTLTPITIYGTYTTSATAYMDGIQLGVMGCLKTEYLAFSPFFLYQNLSGSVTVNDTSMDIPSQSMKTFGIDVTFRPLNITLSGLMQQVDQNAKYSTFFISLSYDFRFGGAGESDSQDKPKTKN